uniref:Uncharacterized protein n=1 Tax=Conchiformibius kuhniae TaxID=211502 RepID=A0A8T9MWP4_9NEIS|nr:hypothetical protein LVJ77_03360 [Conchiformibius kuhniae]
MQTKKIAVIAAAAVLLCRAAHAEPETVIEINPAIPAAELKGKARKRMSSSRKSAKKSKRYKRI